jgi:hypothetical protein
MTPSGKVKSQRPSADTGEKVTLRIAVEIPCRDISNAPVVYVPRR